MLGQFFNPYRTPYMPQPTQAGQLDYLEHRLAVLELACAGLWELLKRKNGYTDEELANLIHEMDMRDGSADQRQGQAPNAVCPQCGRPMLTKTSTKCLWCGCDLPAKPF